MSKKVYAVADSAAAEQELARAASALDAGAVVLSVREGNFLNAVPAVLAKLEEAKPDVILTLTSKNGRLIAGLAAAKFETTVLSDISELTVTDEGVETARLVYGGSAVRKELAVGPVVLCVAEGTIQGEEVAASIEAVAADGDCVKVVEKREKTVQAVNLAAAKKVVCAGRGVKNESVLSSLTEVAELLGAELGCTRPVAEENHWMPRERYIGVSGAVVKPDVYLAVGVSGQMQHMVGCSDAGVILAINSDKNSPIFKSCDYGIVGDAAAILPMIAEQLK